MKNATRGIVLDVSWKIEWFQNLWFFADTPQTDFSRIIFLIGDVE